MTRYLQYNRHFSISIDDEPDKPFSVTFGDPNECLTLLELDATSFKEFIIEMLSYLPPVRKYDVLEEEE